MKRFARVSPTAAIAFDLYVVTAVHRAAKILFPKQINKLKCAFGNKYYTKLRLYITSESISTLVKTYILLDTQGMPGQSGSPGAPGAVGIKGSSGRPGSPGENGYTGMTGEQGPQGNPGINGQEGEQGNPGAKGSKGATVRIYN